MKIGIVTTWFERGAAYVSKQFMESLESIGHEVFIYARGGEEFAKGNEKWDHDNVTWNHFLFSPVPTDIDKNQYETWLVDNGIEVVIFNEQQYWQPVLWTKKKSIKTIAYIDYYTKETVPLFEVYDQLWCNTKRHASAFEWHDGVKYLPWGTNVNLFKPTQAALVTKQYPTVSFFHSAGMNPYRKGTDFVILAAIRLLKRGITNFKVTLHSQTNIDNFFPELKSEISLLIDSGKLEIIEKTVSAPGLYYLGDVYVYPSRLEGIGLTIVEALSCGLPVIVPNEGPMNEFVEMDSCKVVDVAEYKQRKDGYYWDMAFVDVEKLSEAMLDYIENPTLLVKAKNSVRQHALNNLDFDKNKASIQTALKALLTREFSVKSENEIDLYDAKYTRFFRDVPSVYRTIFSCAKILKRRLIR